MKKYILIFIAFLAINFVSKAQNTKTLTVASASITNTGTGTLTAVASDIYKQISFQVNVTKVSGTVAGKITLLGSLDGVNYRRIGGLDSVMLSDQAVNVGFLKVADCPFNYFKLFTTGTGTMVATNAGVFKVTK